MDAFLPKAKRIDCWSKNHFQVIFINFLNNLSHQYWDNNTAFSELFEVDIQVYRYATSIVPNHEYIHPNSNLTVRLYFLNGDHYNLLKKNIEYKYKQNNLNQISKEEMKKCVKSTHIINKPNLNFMGEEEIVAAEKKYEAILDYCLRDPNTPKYPNKILNYETKMRNNKKKRFRDLVAKGKWFKAEILQRDDKEERVLYRNWEFNNNEEEKENIKWMRYPREFEAREIMLKTHTDTGSHLTIQITIQKIVEMG